MLHNPTTGRSEAEWRYFCEISVTGGGVLHTTHTQDHCGIASLEASGSLHVTNLTNTDSTNDLFSEMWLEPTRVKVSQDRPWSARAHSSRGFSSIPHPLIPDPRRRD